MDTQSSITNTFLLRCPISKTLCYDPVIAEDGYTYERRCIEAHFETTQTSPKTNQPIGIRLTSNLILKQIIKNENVLYNNTDLRLLRCPISMSFFYDPVIAEDGYTYERRCIEAHFEIKQTSPMTNQPIGISLTSNLILKQIIQNVLSDS